MIIVRSFERSIVRSSDFSCGELELDLWLKNYAGQHEKRGTTRTLLALDEREACVAGYVAMTAFHLEPAEGAAALATAGRYPVPAMLIARLAVHSVYQGAGVGRLLLIEALQRLEPTSYDVGFEVVVVHALHESAACFYLKHGFRRTVDNPLMLFMTTRDLRATFAVHPD